MDSKQVVVAFWDAMRSNDFAAASQWLTEDFEGIWPQSSEVVCGRENFTAINTAYPANGRWQFVINSIVHEGSEVVTDVLITDGVIKARAITFSTVVFCDKGRGLIQKQVEFWPDDYEAPLWRAEWVQSSES